MRSSAGEHLVDIEGVTGSIPVASTILLNNLAYRRPQALARNWPECMLRDVVLPAYGACWTVASTVFGSYRKLRTLYNLKAGEPVSRQMPLIDKGLLPPDSA